MNDINVKNYIIVNIKGTTHELSQNEANQLYFQLKQSLNISDYPWLQPTPYKWTYDVWYSNSYTAPIIGG